MPGRGWRRTAGDRVLREHRDSIEISRPVIGRRRQHSRRRTKIDTQHVPPSSRSGFQQPRCPLPRPSVQQHGPVNVRHTEIQPQRLETGQSVRIVAGVLDLLADTSPETREMIKARIRPPDRPQPEPRIIRTGRVNLGEGRRTQQASEPMLLVSRTGTQRDQPRPRNLPQPRTNRRQHPIRPPRIPLSRFIQQRQSGP